MDQACLRAHYYHNYSYRTVKKICESGLYEFPIEDMHSIPQEPKHRGKDLQLYSELTGLGVIAHE